MSAKTSGSRATWRVRLWRRRWSKVVLTLFLALPRAMVAQAPEAAPIELRIPPTIATFAMQRRHDFDDPSEGVQLRYVATDSLPIDVFLYPGPDLAHDCPLECARRVLRDEIDAFQTAFPEMIRRHYVDTITVTTQDSLVPTAHDPWSLGQHLSLSVVRDGIAQRSEFILYYLPGFVIKIRATYTGTPQHVQAVDDFVAAVVPAFTSPAPPASKP